MSENFILTDEQSFNSIGQLSFDFSHVSETLEANENLSAAVKPAIPEADRQNSASVPYPNTYYNFEQNFAAISKDFENDTVEAARFLLRAMPKTDKDLILNRMQKDGCSDRESYHRYLMHILQQRGPHKKGFDDNKTNEIVEEFRNGKIDEKTATYRLRIEANYPVWTGTEKLLQTKQYVEWKSKLERHNTRKYDFIKTLPPNEHFRAREWLGNKKYLFKGESKSIGNFINEQMDSGTLIVTYNTVNGYNLGKYGNLFAQHLINSLQAEKVNIEKPVEEPVPEQNTEKKQNGTDVEKEQLEEMRLKENAIAESFEQNRRLEEYKLQRSQEIIEEKILREKNAQFFVKNKHSAYMAKYGWGSADDEHGFATREEAQTAADQWNERYGGDVSVVGRNEAKGAQERLNEINESIADYEYALETATRLVNAGNEKWEGEKRRFAKKLLEEWNKRGFEDYKVGKLRKVPYEEIVKPGIKIGSPESDEGHKMMDAWYRGWDRANTAGFDFGDRNEEKGDLKKVEARLKEEEHENAPEHKAEDKQNVYTDEQRIKAQELLGMAVRLLKKAGDDPEEYDAQWRSTEDHIFSQLKSMGISKDKAKIEAEKAMFLADNIVTRNKEAERKNQLIKPENDNAAVNQKPKTELTAEPKFFGGKLTREQAQEALNNFGVITGNNFEAANNAIKIATEYDKKRLLKKDAVKQIIELGFSEKEAIDTVNYHSKEERIKRMREEYGKYKEAGKITNKERQLADEIESKTGYKLVRYSGHTDDSGGSLTFFNNKNNKEMHIAPWGSGNNGFEIILVTDNEWTDSKVIKFNVPLMSDEAITRIAAATNNYNEEPVPEQKQEPFQFRPFGAWTDFNSRLSLQERVRINHNAVSVLEKGEINDFDRAILRRYSGFGGISASDERGVLYDYYTSPPVAHLVWQLLEKAGTVKNGASVLEPSCGTGVFFEYAPKDKALFFTGVELDERTAQVAQRLQSAENIEVFHNSFEAFNLSGRAGSFDHVIGNAPFGERGAALSSLDMPEEKSLDNYFVSRAIDNLKDGGTMALIVAPGVLENKTNEEFRMALQKKAQFAGAVKLPNRSFYHSHTQVMPDILLFRKYPKDIQDRLSALDDATFKTTPFYDSDFVSGTYFEKYPQHIAGTLSRGTGQWGNDEIKGDITRENLDQIISSFKTADIIPEDFFEQTRDNLPLPDASKNDNAQRLSDEELIQLKDKTLRRGALKVSENQVYLLTENHTWLLVSENEKLANKINDVKAISIYVHAIQDDMKDEKDVLIIQAKQKQCRVFLLDYLKKYNAYPLNDNDLKRFTREHPAVQGVYEAFLPIDDPLLVSENVYRKQADVVDGHNAAVQALLSLRENMKEADEETIRALFPDTAGSLIDEMREHKDIFYTPDGFYQLREDFISGDAWKKIDALKAASEKENDAWKKEKLLYGAAELEKAVGWTPIEDADFSPRSSWIPQEIVREWASSKDALGKSLLGDLAKNDEGKWGIKDRMGITSWQEYADPLIYYLNGQKQRSKYYDTESFNKEHDDLFRSFISNHETYRAQLESEYNRKFKTHIVAPVKTYPVEIAGWKNAEEKGKTIKSNQWQSVHHLYRNQGGISAMGTGFGKTVTSVALMSLLRQEGKSHRVFLQVPNNKIKDWIEEIRSVMPSLKIASVDPEEPGYSNRDKRYAKYQAMARSDADIILMPESSASEIQLSAENDAKVAKNVATLYKMEKADGTARQQEKAEIKGEYKSASGKTNATICFEDFGCDALFVDEAHRYKNLFSSTLSRETGMNDGRQSAKAMSLYKKSEYIRGQNNGKNVYLLTATPLTNSPLEYYNMMQYVAPDELRRMGIATIDGFIREFANIEMGWLYDWGNGQAKQGHILTGFKNLPTLQNLFFAYTDLQNNPEAVGLEKPAAENHPHVIASDKKQMEAVKAVSEELDRYKSLTAEKRQDEFPGQNFLTFYSQMRTASLDLELYDPVKYKDWKNPKLDALARNAFANYKETNGGQVIFCDRVFSSDASFNIHDKIKKELVSQGFKEKEIVIVNGFTKSGGNKSDSMIEKEVSKAIADYNAGKYKVIIGSTACIGEGVNLQKNSSAVHHFDIPFRPSDFIQRNGRVDRQGNEQEKVSLHTYLAAGTIDNYSVNLVQRKANWIDQMLRTKSDVFTNPNDENSIDADELLLALTEEWGDKDAAVKRKEALEMQKQEKIKEAREKQMKGNLKSLSLARGAILPLKENTAEYKKRFEQITSLEASLKNNPVFTKHDLLENHDPFLYDGGVDKIYRKNDVIITNNGTYLVGNFNFKKQELVCEIFESDEERGERVDRAKIHGGDASNTINRNFTLSELGGEKNRRGYSYSEVLHHLEKTSKDEQEILKNLENEKFYNFTEDEKEKYYDMHLAVIENSYGGNFSPVVFSVSKDGILELSNGRYRSSRDEKPLNPFSTEGRTSILKALEKGVFSAGYYKISDSMIETLGNTIPELKDYVVRAVDKAEKLKLAKEQEEALKEELLKQAAVKINADTNHLDKHVHVVKFRL